MRVSLVAIVSFLALCAPAAGQSRPPGAVGGVHVSSLPSGAEVWIDGTYIGRSPVLVEALGQGRHTLTVTKAGWASQELPIDVPSDAVAMQSVRLAVMPRPSAPRAQGFYIIRKLPPAAQAVVDGVPVGSDPHELPIVAGMHHLSVTTAHGTSQQDFIVYPDTLTALAFLDAAPQTQHAPVIALCADYLPEGSYGVAGGRFTVRYGGHEIAGTIGETAMRFDGVTIAYDSAPAIIGGRLYLPLALLEKLSGRTAKPK